MTGDRGPEPKVDARQYWTLPDFADVYLEDTWVLDVSINLRTVEFHLDLVLRESHQSYEPPRVGEQYCYRKSTLVFDEVTSVNWTERGAQPAQGASGELDYGNIDSLSYEGNHFHLSGEWGVMEIVSTQPPRLLIGAD
jgi:hypothetical protein